MRCVMAWIAAAFAAMVGCCGSAGASYEIIGDGDVPTRVVFFSGIDLWRNGGFTHGGFLYAPQGLGADGFVFKALINGGAYRYHAGTTQIIGQQSMATALPGWRFRRGKFELTVFAGLDVQNHQHFPVDPTSKLRGTQAGARGGFDVWYEPFENVMVSGSVSASTVGMSYWTRAAAGYRFADLGWRLIDSLWVGPEFHAAGDDNYRQLRFGAHVTSIRLGRYEFAVGAGFVTDSDKRSGAYGRLGLLFRPFDLVEPEKPTPF